MEEKKLYKSNTNKKLCGVCGSDSEKESHVYKDGSCELCLSKKALVLSLSERQREILLAGGTLNYTKNKG